jgi:hypothetical protein
MQIGRWAAEVNLDDVPAPVIERALLHVLDCVGLAYASSNFDFAKRALATVSELARATPSSSRTASGSVGGTLP